MADLDFDFDPSTVEPDKFDLLPPGEYIVQLAQAEAKATKDGMGKYIAMQFEILDGDHTGRRLFDNLNLWNNNQTTVEIAQKSLSALCRAAGVGPINNTDPLLAIPVIAVVKVSPPKNGYEASNRIQTYKSVGEASTANPQPGGAARPVAAAANATRPVTNANPTAASRPWARKAS
jgi:hypothetical protein